MAQRHRVWGDSTRDATAWTKRALTQWGTGGQAVPTSSDDVFFDNWTNNVIISWTVNCLTLNCTGFNAGSLSWSWTLNTYWSVTFINTMTRAYTGTLKFNTNNCTLTTAWIPLQSWSIQLAIWTNTFTCNGELHTLNFTCASSNKINMWSNDVYIYGSITLTNPFVTTRSGALILCATSTGKTVNMWSTGIDIWWWILFDGIGGEWTVSWALLSWWAGSEIELDNWSIIFSSSSSVRWRFSIFWTWAKSITLTNTATLTIYEELDLRWDNLTLSADSASTVFLVSWTLYGAWHTFWMLKLHNFNYIYGNNTFKSINAYLTAVTNYQYFEAWSTQTISWSILIAQPSRTSFLSITPWQKWTWNVSNTVREYNWLTVQDGELIGWPTYITEWKNLWNCTGWIFNNSKQNHILAI